MIGLLAKIFIKREKYESEQKRRSAYATLCCCVGIMLNVLLFAVKAAAGAAANSIAITADAFNNLSDAGSSVITLAGIRLAGKRPDTNHPFGHGRVEYLSGLAVSVIIIVVGVELFRSGVEKIIAPEPTLTSAVSFVILALSILVKGYMFIYNRGIGRKINSSGMKATAADSLADAAATGAVLAASLISHFTDIYIDGWCGLLVSLFIIYAGASSARDTIGPLLGSPPEKEFVKEIERIVTASEKIEGIHDLIVHDYGPGRVMVSLHAEVDGKGDIFELHDEIDNIEQTLARTLGCVAVIHMDPIDKSDSRAGEYKKRVEELVRELSPDITLHDFRLVPGKTHTNLIFDVVVPFEVEKSDGEIKDFIAQKVKTELEGCAAVVNIDRPFV